MFKGSCNRLKSLKNATNLVTKNSTSTSSSNTNGNTNIKICSKCHKHNTLPKNQSYVACYYCMNPISIN